MSESGAKLPAGTAPPRSERHPVPGRLCVDAPSDTDFTLFNSKRRAERFRVSGLSAHRIDVCRRPAWRCADRIHIALARSWALQSPLGFPDPVSTASCGALEEGSGGRVSCEGACPFGLRSGGGLSVRLSHEDAVIGGKAVRLKVAHVRLCHSRMFFVRAYFRESQEMVFDAHEKAVAFFGGACAWGIYDNMRTAVDGVCSGKDRAWNARFLRMCSHYLVEPAAGKRARVDLACIRGLRPGTIGGSKPPRPGQFFERELSHRK